MDLIVCIRGLFILLMSAAFLEGLKIEVKKQKAVAGNTGEEVLLQCPLKHSSDVLQVMWQKILSEEKVTVATCRSSRHRLNPEFSRRIGRRGTGVQNCSLVLHNVTKQDEGCYLCLFITSSDVAYTGKICLQIHELQGPFEEKQVNTSVPVSTDFENMTHIVSGPSAMDSGFILSLCIGLCFACVVIIAAVLLLVKEQKKCSVLRDDKNVEKGDEVKTPLKCHTDEEKWSLRKRTPLKKENKHSMPSSSKRLFK